MWGRGGGGGCPALITHQSVPQRSWWLLPPRVLVHSWGLGYSVAEPHCPASASEGHGAPFCCLLSFHCPAHPRPWPRPRRPAVVGQAGPRTTGSRLCSHGGGREGTHGPHAPPGKHGGPHRLEHDGLGVPVLLNMGARQNPGRQAGHCASSLALPLQNHKYRHSEGKGSPAHSGPTDLSAQHQPHTHQEVMGTAPPHSAYSRAGRKELPPPPRWGRLGTPQAHQRRWLSPSFLVGPVQLRGHGCHPSSIPQNPGQVSGLSARFLSIPLSPTKHVLHFSRTP